MTTTEAPAAPPAYRRKHVRPKYEVAVELLDGGIEVKPPQGLRHLKRFQAVQARIVFGGTGAAPGLVGDWVFAELSLSGFEYNAKGQVAYARSTSLKLTSWGDLSPSLRALVNDERP